MLIEIFIKRTHFHKKSGGLETQSKELAEGLVRLGYKVNVVSPKYELNETQKTENGVEYTFLDCWYSNSERIAVGFSKNSWAIESLFYYKETNPDLVISQSSAGYLIIKEKDRIPVLAIAHGTILREFRTFIKKGGYRNPYNFLKTSQYIAREYFGKQKEFINKSDFVVTVSEDVKNDLLKETKVNADKVKVIYVGVDSARFLKPNITNLDPIKLIYVGVLIKEKGAGFAISAISKLKNKFKDIKLTIVGDGEDKEYFESLSKELDLDNYVDFTGRVDYAQIPTLLNQHNIFIHPSVRDEGFPMVMLEAVTAGLPIIATDKGGTRNVVKSGINGILLNPDENVEQQIIDAISFIKDGMKLEDMSKESLKISKEFSFDKVMNQYDKIIKTLTTK